MPELLQAPVQNSIGWGGGGGAARMHRVLLYAAHIARRVPPWKLHAVTLVDSAAGGTDRWEWQR